MMEPSSQEGGVLSSILRTLSGGAIDPASPCTSNRYAGQVDLNNYGFT